MLENTVKDLLKAVHESQGIKKERLQITVTVPMRTPTGEIINIPAKKVASYKALGLGLEEA